MFIGIVGWIAMGLLVGFVTGKIVNLRGDDPRLGLAVTCMGAIFGAVLYTIISGAGVSRWNLWSLMFATLGAIAAAVVWHLVRSRFVSHAAYTTRRSY